MAQKSKQQPTNRRLSMESKKMVLSIALVGLIVGAVITNDNINKQGHTLYTVSENFDQQNRIQNLNRSIASAKPLNPLEEVQWEHSIARKLANADLPSVTSGKVSSVDELRHGVLGTKYQFIFDQSLISEIRYIEATDTVEFPVTVSSSQFLQDYSELFAVDYVKFQLSSKIRRPAQTGVALDQGLNNRDTGRIETWDLLDSEGRMSGTATFEFDEEGRMHSFSVQKQK